MELDKLLDLLDKYRGKKILIALKGSPDPDCISSGMALAALCESYDIETKIYHDRPISLPQNNRMINELDINLIKIDSFDKIDETFDGYAVVDYQDPRIEGLDIPCLIHIDHHKMVKGTTECVSYHCVKTDYGSAATILTFFLKELNFFKTYSKTKKLSTALAYGIKSDTDNLNSAEPVDYEAMVYLSEYLDKSLLQSIARNSLSKTSLNCIIKALDSKNTNMIIKENWLFAGVGYVKSTSRDSLAAIADILISVDCIENVVVYGVVENGSSQVEGCVRTFDGSYDLDGLLKTLFKDGGSKKNKGAFKITLGAFEDCSDKDKVWEVVKDMVYSKFAKEFQFSNNSEQLLQ